jgi:cellulose synthase (UDP-forming)
MIAYVAAVMAGVLYAIFIFNPHNAGQRIPYVVLILAEIILLSNAGVMIMTVLAGDKSSELPAVEEARRKLLQGAWMPTVDVLIPVYGEPPEVIRTTATAARLCQRLDWVLEDRRTARQQHRQRSTVRGWFPLI